MNMHFKKINNLTGWTVCLIACAVYILTSEKKGSLWDCGEFLSSAYKLQIPHPPGAPLFVLIARFFIILFGNQAQTAAKAVNVMSAVASGFTILFLFWTITHFAKKIIINQTGVIKSRETFSIMTAGIIGALAYTFSDSFWYSAVEGEVYALSSLFTAIVFWAITKWEVTVTENSTANYADRWIVFIAFMMGLSIGVHLLNLLTIPAIVMVYYYKRYQVTRRGTVLAFLIGCVITGFVQKVVIQYLVVAAGYFDIFFVNDLGLPFFSGFGAFFILLGFFIWYGLKLANRKNLTLLRLGIWCITFMLLGYSTYLTTMIRSNANPAVDIFNVDNPISLAGYLGREQYGDFPLLYGPKFTADPIDFKETSTKYSKGNKKYIASGKEGHYVFPDDKMMFFPRVWDITNDQNHRDYYAQFLGIGKYQNGTYERDPDFMDNLKFFISYQTYWMYFRYFMWNFSGKQNDVQGFFNSNVRDGNWITGFSFIDNLLYGNQNLLPDSSKNNKAHNKLFMLPLLFGILGVVYQYKKSKQDFTVTFLLFFFTGFAIVLYLNQPGFQPRERDYAYVGSFYAFAIWIGFGFLQISDWVRKRWNQPFVNGLAGVLCLMAVPVLMAAQEWDDHDRSKKQLALDVAKDYLESCAPNAILFTAADNDTYPLWYAQEVEGVRPDVRIIIYTLLGTDWYINQLRYKINNSNPIDVIWTADQILGSKRDYVRFKQIPGVADDRYYDLYDLMKNYIGSDDPAKMMQVSDDEMINTFPIHKVFLPVDTALVKQNGTVNKEDAVVNEIRFDIPKNVLMKNDLALLNIMAANKWKRPIYFTNAFSELGFSQYLRRDGLTYRLVPVAESKINTDWMADKLMHRFGFGGANVKGVYFDDENRRQLNIIRNAFSELAFDSSIKGKKAEARMYLQQADNMMLPENFPYGHISPGNMHNRTSLSFLQACYMADEKSLAHKVKQSVEKDLQQQLRFYDSLEGNKAEWMAYEKKNAAELLDALHKLNAAYEEGK